MSQRDDMIQARDFIQQRRYDDALDILYTLDHPTAQKWIDRIHGILDKQQPAVASPEQTLLSEPSDYQKFWATPQASTQGNPEFALIIYAIIAGLVGAGVLTAYDVWSRYVPIVWVTLACVYGFLAMIVGVKITKVRDGFVGGALGAFLAVIMWLGFYGMTYVYDQSVFINEYGTADAFQREIEYATGQTGIIGYFLYRSTFAVTITYRDFPIHFEGTIMLVSMFADLLISMGVIGYQAYKRTQEPFCEQANKWINFKVVGRVKGEKAHEVLYHIRSGEYALARKFYNYVVSSREPYIIISVGECAEQGFLRVQANKLETTMEGTHKVNLKVVRALRKK